MKTLLYQSKMIKKGVFGGLSLSADRQEWENNGKSDFVKLSGVSDSPPCKGGVARLRDGVVGAGKHSENNYR